MNPEPAADGHDDATDEELVALVVGEGSEISFRLLYRRHTPRLLRLAFRLLQSEDDAEDVVQETWLRGAAKLAEFQWRSSLSTWLASITVNVSRDVLDRRGRWVDAAVDPDELPHAQRSEGEPVDLERAIASLPPGCRVAFVLHDVEGFTHEEIAERFGYTAGTSKSQVFRARRALRRMLNGTEVEGAGHAAE